MTINKVIKNIILFSNIISSLLFSMNKDNIYKQIRDNLKFTDDSSNFDDCEKIALTKCLGNYIKVYDIQKIINEYCKDWILFKEFINDNSKEITSITFSPDCKYLVSTYNNRFDRIIKIWDLKTGNIIKILNAQGFPIISLVFSPDHKYIASGCWDGIDICDLSTFFCVKKYNGHNNVNSLSFSADSKFLASGSTHDKNIKIWDIANDTLVNTLSDTVIALKFSPCLNNENFKINIDSKALSEKANSNNLNKNYGKLAPYYISNKYLASASKGNSIKIWDILSGYCVKIFNGHNPISDLVFAPDGKSIAFIEPWSNIVKICDFNNGNIAILNCHTDFVNLIAISSFFNKPVLKSFSEIEDSIEAKNNKYLAIVSHSENVILIYKYSGLENPLENIKSKRKSSSCCAVM